MKSVHPGMVSLSIFLAVTPVATATVIWRTPALSGGYKVFFLLMSIYFVWLGLLSLADTTSLKNHPDLYWHLANLLLDWSIWAVLWVLPTFVTTVLFAISQWRAGVIKSKVSFVVFSAAAIYFALASFYFMVAVNAA